MSPTGGRLVLRDRRPTGGAVLALAATLTFGCARPIDLANSGSPDSELAALVDSDAARRLLADVLARRMAEATLPVATESSHFSDLASSEPQLGNAGTMSGCRTRRFSRSSRTGR